MDKPLVSVVIPVYNGQTYLARAVDGVLAQTWPNIEAICVNDGSTDRSAEILAGYGPRLVVVEQENQGVAGARNAGIKRATGRFVAFLDQDDWWCPEKIARQIDVFSRDDRTGLVHTDVAHWDEAASEFTGPLDPDAEPQRLAGDCFDRLLLDNQIYNSSVIVRASVLDEVGPCDTQIRGNSIQDYDLWLRIARHARFGFVPEPLTVFRVHAGQGTWDRRLMLSEEARMLERVVAEEKLADRDDVRRRMARLYDQLGTAHLDSGSRQMARRSFARSLRWRPSSRAAMLWTVCFLPAAAIGKLQAARAKRRT